MMALLLVPLAAALLGAPVGDDRHSESDGSLGLHVTQPLLQRGENLSAIATVSTTAAPGTTFVLTAELVDAAGRVMDRVEIHRTVTASSMAAVPLAAGEFELPFQLSTEWVLTMVATLRGTGTFGGGGGGGGGGTVVTATPLNVTVTPDPLDYDDYWVNVWGGGSASSPQYYDALRQAHVNLGHLYRDYDYDGKPYNDGTSYGSYHGAAFNLRPNHDFLEDKLWFEMAETQPLPEVLKAVYSDFLHNGSYGTPAGRRNFIRPVSLSAAGSLDELEQNIRPRMERSARFRPSQWNIADEYGWFHRANPFDFDIGPDSMAQFVVWLRTRYAGSIAQLNEAWGTKFPSFASVGDPINAPPGGEGAWILTQEIRDQQLPLNSGSGLTAGRNWAPWSEFRTFSDQVFAAAQARCVAIGRSIDPSIRVGFEGGEASTPLSGYDWARQLWEIGSIESYDLANGPEYIRSMRYNKYNQRIFSFITLFDAGEKSPATGDRENVYTLWYRLLHYGVTGAPIWWDKNFFKNDTNGDYGLTPYAKGIAPTFAEFESGIVKLLQTAEWDDAEVALLYSMPSIQISWMMDSEMDGKSWNQRSNSYEPDHLSHAYDHVGWSKLLEDVSIKGRFLSYLELDGGNSTAPDADADEDDDADDANAPPSGGSSDDCVLSRRGVKVLILPRTLALSSSQRSKIEAWVANGGTLIADSLTGIYDEKLRRRSIADGGGWWDDFLGVKRTDYAFTEMNGEAGSAFGNDTAAPAGAAGSGSSGSGSKLPPPQFRPLLDGLTAAGLRGVEPGLRVGSAIPLLEFGGKAEQPALLVKAHGAGKIVYMNLGVTTYGFGPPPSDDDSDDSRDSRGGAGRTHRQQRRRKVTGGSSAEQQEQRQLGAEPPARAAAAAAAPYVDERQTPASASAKNLRQLTTNLLKLGGVVPKLRVTQGHTGHGSAEAEEEGEEVYNYEKSVHLLGGGGEADDDEGKQQQHDGIGIKGMVIGGVINSFMDGDGDDWGHRNDTAEVRYASA